MKNKIRLYMMRLKMNLQFKLCLCRRCQNAHLKLFCTCKTNANYSGNGHPFINHSSYLGRCSRYETKADECDTNRKENTQE